MLLMIVLVGENGVVLVVHDVAYCLLAFGCCHCWLVLCALIPFSWCVRPAHGSHRADQHPAAYRRVFRCLHLHPVRCLAALSCFCPREQAGLKDVVQASPIEVNVVGHALQR